MIQVLASIILLLTLTGAQALAASHFDGADSAIVVTQQAAINVDTFTAGCWGTYAGLGEGNLGRMMEKDAAWIIGIVGGTPNKLRLNVYGWTVAGEWRVNLPAAGVWFHFAASYDATDVANDPVLYLNGVASGTQTTGNSGTFAAGTGNLIIGNSATSIRTWNGELGECFFYNRVLTALEVMQVYRAGPVSLPRGLILYAPLGVFGARNYTSTSGLDGVETAITQVGSGPPLGYGSQSGH